MSGKNHDLREDRAVEQAWEQVMATGGEPRLLPAGEEADPALVREYTELLGLLPYQLAAESPPARVKDAIMAQAAGHSAAGVPAEASPVVPFERPSRPEPAPRSAWRYAQAAVLAASLLGMGFLSATVWQQNRQIAQLNGQLQASDPGQGDVLRIRDEMRSLRDRLDMVTTVARYAYPLRTASAAPRPGGAPGNAPVHMPEGIVYVCGMHQQWYLSLRGLKPPADGGEYHLWFMTEEGKVDGGVLEVRPGAPAEMEAQTMPDGTHGFLVTLETPDQPEGLKILLGESAVNL